MKHLKTVIHPLAIVDILKEFQNIDKKKFFGKKIGSLLGYHKKKNIFCTSAFRIPFQQKTKENWFFDQVFMEKMATMHKKINSREKIIGWYILKKNLTFCEFRIHQIFFGYTHHPIFLHIWANKEANGLIIEIFSEQQKNQNGNKFLKTVPVEIGMLESEEIAIHQILSNSNNSPYITSFNIATKWQYSLIFFLKYVQKVIKDGKNKNLFFHSELFEFDFFEKFRNSNKISKKNDYFQIEKRMLILYVSSILRLFFSIENLGFISHRKI